MRRLVLALLSGLVFIPFPLHAQSVTLNICNTGAVDLDAIFSGGGQVLDSKIRPATCAAVAKSEGGGMAPAYLGFAFTDSRGQYGAARRFASPNTLTLADGSRTVQRRNVSVPLQLLFQPDFPVCEKVPTGTSAVLGNTTIVEVTNVCEDLGYTLLVETHLDSHEISLEFESISGVLSLNNRRVTFSEKPEIDWAGEEAKRKAHEQPVPVKWSDLLATLRNPRYPPRSSELRDVLPYYFVVRGTVSGVEVLQHPVGPTTNISVAHITFRESPAVPHWRPGTRPIPEFNVCTERMDILQEKFGADFLTSMIGKTVEVHGLPFGEECYGQRASFQIYLGRQIGPVPSAVFAADARVWVPPVILAPAPPRLLTIDELAGNIVQAALKSAYQDNFQKLQAACTDQTNKAHKANPANYAAINKEYEACLVAVDGKMAAMPAPQQSAEKARPCAQQLMKAYPDGDRRDPTGFNEGVRACVQAYLGNPSPVGTPAAGPASAPALALAPTPPAAPVAAPARPAAPAALSPTPRASGLSVTPTARAGALPIASISTQWVGRSLVATGTVARVETIRGVDHVYFEGTDFKYVLCIREGMPGMQHPSELVGKTLELSVRIDWAMGCLDQRVTVGATELRQSAQLRIVTDSAAR